MKTIVTDPGGNYTVTVTKATEIIGLTIAGVELVLASSSKAGQLSFQAISQETRVTDDAAVVLPLRDPAEIPDDLTADQVAEMIESAVSTPEEEVHATPTGTDNALFYWAEVAAANVPAGELHEIAIQCRSTAASAMTTAPRYLGLWEATEAGGWARVGTSLNAVVQAVGVGSVWSFEGVTLAGRALRLCLLPDRDSDWQPDNQVFGARVAAATDGSKITFTSGHSNFLPEMRIAVTTHESRFAPAAHVEDMVAHITAAERTAWNGKADASALATKVNSSTFTSHVNDAVKHVTAAERTAWNAVASGTMPGNSTISNPGGLASMNISSDSASTLFVQRMESDNSQNGVGITVNQQLTKLDLYGAATGFDLSNKATPLDTPTARCRITATTDAASMRLDNMPLTMTIDDTSMTLDKAALAALAELLANKDALLALLTTPATEPTT